jgi:glycosyltransferase involved in cell wall biosynthesis
VKVLHVIPSLSATQGGPSFALPLMERALAGSAVEMTVISTDDDGPGHHLPVPLDQPVSSQGATRFYFRKQADFYKVSLPLAHWLKKNVNQFDLVHIHALFSFTSTAAAWAARKQGIPYIIRPLGVLNRWGMENRRKFVKSLSFRFVETPILQHAAALHYTSHAEQQEAEQTGAKVPSVVIPLGIDTAAFEKLPGPEAFLNRFPQARGKKLVLFLSRLDAKKGLDVLLEAWAEIRKSEIGNRKSADWLLVIAGSGNVAFERGLREQADRLGMTEDILWPGFLAGAEKLSALAAATVFVLPSYSENFGIALVEALAAGLPCLTTTGVAVSREVADSDAGLVVPPEKTRLAAALEKLLADEGLRERLGGNARRLAQAQFSLAALREALLKFYHEIIFRKK